MKELLASVKMLSIDTLHTLFFNLSLKLDYDQIRFSPCFSLTNSVLFFQTVVKFTVKATSKNQPQAKQWKTMWNIMADSAVIFHNTFYVCPVLCLVQLFYWSASLSVLQPVSLMFHYFTDYVLRELLGLSGLSPLSVVLQFKESAVEKSCLSERSLSEL